MWRVACKVRAESDYCGVRFETNLLVIALFSPLSTSDRLIFGKADSGSVTISGLSAEEYPAEGPEMLRTDIYLNGRNRKELYKKIFA